MIYHILILEGEHFRPSFEFGLPDYNIALALVVQRAKDLSPGAVMHIFQDKKCLESWTVTAEGEIAKGVLRAGFNQRRELTIAAQEGWGRPDMRRSIRLRQKAQ